MKYLREREIISAFYSFLLRKIMCSIKLNKQIYIYTYMYIYMLYIMYIWVCGYAYIERETERQRKQEQGQTIRKDRANVASVHFGGIWIKVSSISL